VFKLAVLGHCSYSAFNLADRPLQVMFVKVKEDMIEGDVPFAYKASRITEWTSEIGKHSILTAEQEAPSSAAARERVHQVGKDGTEKVGNHVRGR
jgi:hypothetical protein